MRFFAVVIISVGCVLAQNSVGWAQTENSVASVEGAAQETSLSDNLTLDDIANICAGGGACSEAVEKYMAALAAARLPADAISQAAADLVVTLAEIAQQNTSDNAMSAKISAAISQVAVALPDLDQAEQIVQIAEAIAANQDFQTTSIEFASPN